ncbi:MAG: CBS domain-containing protein [Chloroherpetonaceae bacterium]|nr:CBS domain-containing protein [Chloroherpetonaceae bacterium]MDW8438400.1 CBS domain-containing protein [Chloroherpetonaceae bacterium]
MSRLTLRSDVPTLKLADTLAAAALLIQETQLGGLPILKQDKLVGTLLESDVEMLTDAGEKNLHRSISSFPLYAPITLDVNAHPYHAIALFGKIQHDFLPVVDKEMNYHGVVLRDDAMREFFERFHFSDDASLLEIEAPAQFRLSDLIRLLEQNETRVLSLSTRRSDENEDAQLITMQIQTRDAFRLQRTLERYGYCVTYNSHPSSAYEDDLAQKAQAFLRYLEM